MIETILEILNIISFGLCILTLVYVFKPKLKKNVKVVFLSTLFISIIDLLQGDYLMCVIFLLVSLIWYKNYLNMED